LNRDATSVRHPEIRRYTPHVCVGCEGIDRRGVAVLGGACLRQTRGGAGFIHDAQVPLNCLRRYLFVLLLHGIGAGPHPRRRDRLDADRGLRLQRAAYVASRVEHQAVAGLYGPSARSCAGAESVDLVAVGVGKMADRATPMTRPRTFWED